MSAYSKCCWPKCRRRRAITVSNIETAYCAIHCFYTVTASETDQHLEKRITALERSRGAARGSSATAPLIYAERRSLLLLKALRWNAEIRVRERDLDRRQAELDEEALAILGLKKHEPVKLEPGERFLDL